MVTAHMTKMAAVGALLATFAATPAALVCMTLDPQASYRGFRDLSHTTVIVLDEPGQQCSSRRIVGV